MEYWTNQQQSFTVMTPLSPAAMTISSCDRINCSYCNYDRQFYSSSSSSTQEQTPSQHMIVNMAVVTNFQVNVIIQHNQLIH
jgi:hypothetical protein